MENKILVIFVAVLLIGSVIYDFFSKNKLNKKRNLVFFELMDLVEKKDNNRFYKKIDEQECIELFPEYNRMFLKLNVSILNHETKKTDELFEGFKKIYMRKNQKEELYLKGFGYYCTYDSSKAKYYYNLLSKLDLSIDKKEFVNRMYDIYIEKGNKYLDVILNEMKNLPEDKRKESYILLEQIYKNINDTENAQKYNNLYK